MPDQLQVELTQRELDYLKQIHVAKTLKEFMQHPGWDVFTQLVSGLVSNLEEQHLNFASLANEIPSRDAYYASGIRLGAVRAFAKILQEDIRQKISLLDQPLRRPEPPDPADYDGDV